MRTTQKTRERIVDAVAEARDHVLVRIGRRRPHKVAVAAVATGAVIAAGVAVARVKSRRKGLGKVSLSGEPETPE